MDVRKAIKENCVVLTISVVVDRSEANYISRQMEKSHIAQEGIYTLNCGGERELTDDEITLVETETPTEYLFDED